LNTIQHKVNIELIRWKIIVLVSSLETNILLVIKKNKATAKTFFFGAIMMFIVRIDRMYLDTLESW
jgi:hypothetical protein